MKNNFLHESYDVIVNELITKLETNNKDCYVIGISGGIDSAVSLKMLVDNVGKEKIKAYYLPIEFENKLPLIKLLEEFCGVKIEVVNLTNLWLETVKTLKITDQFNKDNQKARLRSMFLFAKAFEFNGLVVSNLNYDEYYLGYFTKFGDSNGDCYPLLNWLKRDIFKIAKDLNIPLEIINQVPSADLFSNQTDESDYGFSYESLDDYLSFKDVNASIVDKIKQWHYKNHHKHFLNHLLLKDLPYRRD